MTDEKGYVKFNYDWIKGKPFPSKIIKDINEVRQTLYDKGLIGMNEDGIGFGNVSIRVGSGILVTGSATGGIERLTNEHYTLVNEYDYNRNWLKCIGPIKTSSESLTHEAMYECSPETNAILHIHNLNLWERLLDKVPTTRKDVEYGTPEMAKEIFRLFDETTVSKDKILVMGGHKEGLITFGANPQRALRNMLKYYETNK